MAIKSQGLAVAVSASAAAAVTITAATAANPVHITATNTYAQGDIIQITGVVGMTQLNGGVYVVDTPSGSAFNLKGVDGSAYNAYVSGGSAFKQTMSAVGFCTNATGFDGQASEIDTTHLLSTAKEFLLGLQDFGQMTLSLLQTAGDVGQIKLRSLKAAASIGIFTVTLSDGTVSGFQALVKQYTFDPGGADNAVKNSAVLRITGAPSWFA